MSLTATRPRHDARAAARELPTERLVVAGVAALTAIAFALRFSQIHQSLLGDEVFSYWDIRGRGFGAVLTNVHTGGENSPPLFFLLAWLSAKLGDPTVWLRLPSIVLGSLTVPVIYAIGRETLGRITGLVAATFFAISPFTVYYGTEGRPYATMTFFVTLSTFALLKAVKSRETRWWVLYTASATAAAYSHYTGIFVLLVQGLWSLWRCRDRLRQPLIANAAAAVLYLPWLPQLRGKQLGVIGYLYPLTASNVLKDWPRSLVGYVSASLNQIPTVWGLAVLGLTVIGGLAFVLHRWWRTTPRRLDPGSHLLLLAALALATPVGLLLYSMLFTDLWLPRGLSASIPAAMLVIAALALALPNRVRWVAIGAIAVTLALGTARSFGPDYVREPYRAMAAYVDRVAKPRDSVLVFSFIGQPAIASMVHVPNPVQNATLKTYVDVRHHSYAYLFLDLRIAAALGIKAPHLPWLHLLRTKLYRGSLPTELLVYYRS